MKKWFLVVGGLVLIVCLFFFCLWISANRGRSADIDAMRRAGAITTIEEWNARVPKKGEDAFPFYEKITSQFTRLSKQEQARIAETAALFLKVQRGSEPETGLEKAIANVDNLKPILEEARGASEIPRYVLPYVPEGGNYQDAEGIDSAEGVLAFCAYAESRRGDMDGAFKDFERIGSVLRQLRADLNYSSRLSYSNVQSELLSVLGLVMREHSNNPAVLTRIVNRVEGLPARRDIEDDLKSEALESLHGIQMAEQDPNKYLDGTAFVDSRAHKTITPWERVQVHFLLNKAIHLQRLLYEAMPHDHSDWRGIQQTLFDGDVRAKDLASLGTGSHAYRDDEVAVGDWVQQEARRRMTIACAKILLYRINRGRLPDTLPDFGDNSIDPFKDGPFHYSAKGDSFEIGSQPDGFNRAQGETYKFQDLKALPVLQDSGG